MRLPKNETIVVDVAGNACIVLTDVEEHRTGESQYVSWTPNKDIALTNANKDGAGGVLLSVPKGAPQPGDTWSWGWTHWIQWGEPEMLQEGTRTGVNVSREGCL